MEITCKAEGRGDEVRPAVFIDRDGTINEQMGYINHVTRFVLLPGVGEAIRLLNENGYLVFVVTNQSGVARGYFPIDLVYEVHRYMERLLLKSGARVDGIFFCPHYPSGSVKEFAKNCTCRKPGIGLVEMARDRFEIDMERSWVIGDTLADIEMAHNASLGSVLVKTGYGLGEIEYVLPNRDTRPLFICDDLLSAVNLILTQEK